MDEQIAATASAYDSAAVDFAERTKERSPMATEFFESFMKKLRPSSLVADLGCGPGHDIARLRAAGHRTVALDRSPGLLALCPPASRRILGDLRMLPVAGNSLDAIWSSAALLHVSTIDIATTFTEWDRVLRRNATVAFATSLGGDEGWELAPAGRDRVAEIAEGERRWFVHHTEERLLAAVAAVGWQVVSSAVRSSTRDWLQIVAVTGGGSAQE